MLDHDPIFCLEDENISCETNYISVKFLDNKLFMYVC